jgi:hypothetical protein
MGLSRAFCEKGSAGRRLKDISRLFCRYEDFEHWINNQDSGMEEPG